MFAYRNGCTKQPSQRCRWYAFRRGVGIGILFASLVQLSVGSHAWAQSNSNSSGWTTGTTSSNQTRQRSSSSSKGLKTSLPTDPQSAIVTLIAYLTSEHDERRQPPIDRGLVWRVFAFTSDGLTGSRTTKLVTTRRDSAPTLKLPPGRYAINAAYGRAHLTQILNLDAGTRKRESFVLNAGGLRVVTRVSGRQTSTAKARYDIYSDERNQSGARQRVVTNARPGLITRLNSGIYHIVSRLGDANALVAADVAVEAGKITEAVVNHQAATVTFKLVRSADGEAVADTQWIIMAKSGDIVKETAGALPSHILAPGEYTVSARWGGQLFTQTFAIQSGDNVEVEVVMQ